MKFEFGDEVMWSSQSLGYTKHKIGTVVEVVPPGQYPGKETFHTRKAFTRDHESYYIAVGNKFYWPRVGNLHRKLR